MPIPASSLDFRALLRQQFGYESFRPGQERIIRDLLNGRDVLAVMPTGAGKSLVFQLTAQLLPGLTLVVSPLIALMKDQAESMAAVGVEVGVINSSRPAALAEADLQRAERAEAKLLYVTPERFEDPAFMAEIEGVTVSLLVVDEAHCISEWGYDFRPAYLGLARAAARLGRPPILALTATATPWVRRDILERLGLRAPDVVVRDVDRPNLFFEVRPVSVEAEDRRVLHRLLVEDPGSGPDGSEMIAPAEMRSLLPDEAERYPPALKERLGAAMQGSGIIYCATTRAAAETAQWLREWGIAADYYHGQRKQADRDRVQEAFMTGELRVIAATNAFGLGVDKPGVRFVIHRDVPASIEEYFQEAGRAGRDGLLARCTLIYRPADLGRAAFLSAGSRLTREDVQRSHDALIREQACTPEELARAAGIGKSKAARLLGLLEREGVVIETEGRFRLRVPDFDPEHVSLESETSHREYERSRREMMRHYAELRECRRVYLLNYFGQEAEFTQCELCDNDCREGTATADHARDRASPAFEVGDPVRHVRWGEGHVVGLGPDRITVRFNHGEETLARDLVQEERLLTPLRKRRAMEPNGQPNSNPAGGTPPTNGAPSLAVGEPVVHERFGAGEVEHVAAAGITILFHQAGYKTVASDALATGALRRADPSDPPPDPGG